MAQAKSHGRDAVVMVDLEPVRESLSSHWVILWELELGEKLEFIEIFNDQRYKALEEELYDVHLGGYGFRWFRGRPQELSIT